VVIFAGQFGPLYNLLFSLFGGGQATGRFESSAVISRRPILRAGFIYTAWSLRDRPAPPGGSARNDQRAAARLIVTGLTAGLAAADGADALSQPPDGVGTLTASSGCCSGVKVWIASFAAASD
jgi:hypothetical protein